ncbi:MAG: hypothetical protein AAGA85_13455 [Bacteroidota bacterium]
MMNSFTAADIRSLILKFENLQLPKSEWTHETHLIMALWYCQKYPLAEATRKIGRSIRRYNEAIGIKNTEQSGFHQSLTTFWMSVVSHFASQYPTLPLSELCHLLLNAKEGSRSYVFEFYSKDLIDSTHARMNWLAPDLKSLPGQERE